MNFYQKTVSAIAVAIIGITVAIAFVCFNSPYTGVFITECIALILGELILGAAIIGLIKESDSVLPYSALAGVISSSYLLFTLVMLIPAASDIQLKHFILIHAIGLAIAGISFSIFVFGKRNIEEQEKKDTACLQNKKIFFLEMSEIYEAAKVAIPEEKAALAESAKLMDNLRYAADSISEMEKTDQDVLDILANMKSSISEKNIVEYKEQLVRIKLLYISRENRAKLGRNSVS